MWSARFGALGVRKRLVRVLVEEGALRGTGEDEWEEHLTAALGNHSVRWLQLDGQATTFNWGRVLRPALPRARAARLRAAPRSPPPLPVARNDPNADRIVGCVNCAIWANFRPRRALRRALRGSPVARGEPLACLKGRTMCDAAPRQPPATPPAMHAPCMRRMTIATTTMSMSVCPRMPASRGAALLGLSAPNQGWVWRPC